MRRNPGEALRPTFRRPSGRQKRGCGGRAPAHYYLNTRPASARQGTAGHGGGARRGTAGYVRIVRRQGYLRVPSPAANRLYVRIARRHTYLRVPSPIANSLYVRIACRQGYLRVLSPAANSLYVRIARRQGYLRVPSPSANNYEYFKP